MIVRGKLSKDSKIKKIDNALINKSEMFELNYMNCFNENQSNKVKAQFIERLNFLSTKQNKTRQHKK